MHSMLKSLALASAVALGSLVSPAMAEGERFVMITHGPDSDSWFNTIKN
jgi:simple sugar transport system substrate-binding protein